MAAYVIFKDVGGGEALRGQTSAGVASAVDQEPPFRSIDQDIGLVVVQSECGAGAEKDKFHGKTRLARRALLRNIWSCASVLVSSERIIRL